MNGMEQLDTTDIALAAFCLAKRFPLVEVRQDVDDPAIARFVFHTPVGINAAFHTGGLLVDPAVMHDAMKNLRERARRATDGASHRRREHFQTERDRMRRDRDSQG